MWSDWLVFCDCGSHSVTLWWIRVRSLWKLPLQYSWDFPGSSHSKESACNVGDSGSILGLGRSPGVGNGNPFQCSCLEKSMDTAAWWAEVHGVAKSRTWLSNETSTIGSWWNLCVNKMALGRCSPRLWRAAWWGQRSLGFILISMHWCSSPTV